MQEDAEREVWSNKIDFFLSALGFAVGFGAVWRFPYLVFQNGGGAFLIPYFFMLLTIGLPVFFIEMALGQYSSSGPVRSFKNICPIFGGVGIGMVVNSFLIMLFYNMILAWTLYYLYSILANCVEFVIAGIGGKGTAGIDILDWASCKREWNTPSCADIQSSKKFGHGNGTKGSNITKSVIAHVAALCSNNSTGHNATTISNITNFCAPTINSTAPIARANSPGEEFFYNRLLEIGTGIDDWSWPLPQLVVPLGVAWLIAFLCLARGIKQSGKIVWVTSTFPYVILIVLLIRGCFLPGSGEGIRYFIQPDMKYLLNPQAWIDAAGMILFLLSVGCGGLATYASYNEFNHNIYMDSITIPLLDVGASIIGGFCVFAYVGFIAYTLDVSVPAAVREGTGLLFIALPEATTQMPASVLWAVALCLMLLMLGMDTQFAFVETCVTALLDEWPKLRRYKVWVFALMSVGTFLLGLILTLKSGYFWLNLINYYVGGWPLIVFSLCELFVIMLYGAKRLSENVYAMTGKRFGWLMYTMWYVVSPIILLILLVVSCIQQTPLEYEGVKYPVWAQAIGWLLSLGNVATVPIYAVYAMLTKHKHLSLRARFLLLCKSTDAWNEIEAKQAAKRLKKTSSSSNSADNAAGGGGVHHALSSVFDAEGQNISTGDVALTTISGNLLLTTAPPAYSYFDGENFKTHRNGIILSGDAAAAAAAAMRKSSFVKFDNEGYVVDDEDENADVVDDSSDITGSVAGVGPNSSTTVSSSHSSSK